MEYKTTAKLVIQACAKASAGRVWSRLRLAAAGYCPRALPSTAPPRAWAWRTQGLAHRERGGRTAGLQAHRARRRPAILAHPAGERAIEAYETLQAEINNVIANKANDLITSIKE